MPRKIGLNLRVSPLSVNVVNETVTFEHFQCSALSNSRENIGFSEIRLPTMIHGFSALQITRFQGNIYINKLSVNNMERIT
jgi:hypothetical protein